MNTLNWLLLITPVLVLLLGVRVARYKGRYRGRHVRNAGVEIFTTTQPQMVFGFDAAGRPLFRRPDGRFMHLP